MSDPYANLSTTTLDQLAGFLETEEGFTTDGLVQAVKGSNGYVPTIGFGSNLTDSNSVAAVLNALTVPTATLSLPVNGVMTPERRSCGLSSMVIPYSGIWNICQPKPIFKPGTPSPPAATTWVN